MLLGRRRLVVALAAVGVTVATVAGCDSTAGPVGQNPRQVTVVGSGEVRGVPDTLTVDVAIEFLAPDVTTAMNQTNDRQQAVINALTSGGIESKDISTTQVSLQPQYTDNSVSYSIEDDSKLVRDARARAFNDAKDRAQQYAELSGLSLGKVISVSEVPGGSTPPAPPVPMRGGAMATEVPLQPGEQTVSFAVTGVWELT